MKKETILKAALFAVFLFLHVMGLSSQGDDRDHDDNFPLCKTQIMITNQACKRLSINPNPGPVVPIPIPTPPGPGPIPIPPGPGPRPTPPGPGPIPTPPGPGPRPTPPGPGPIPTPPLPNWPDMSRKLDDNDAGDEGVDGDDARQCCHWLQEIDNDCVCDALLSLPSFLSKPIHEYSVIVDGRCIVTYHCRGLRDDVRP